MKEQKLKYNIIIISSQKQQNFINTFTLISLAQSHSLALKANNSSLYLPTIIRKPPRPILQSEKVNSSNA